MTLTISKNKIIIVLLVLLTLSNTAQLFWLFHHHPDLPHPPFENRFEFLNPNVAFRENKFFQNQQNRYITNLYPLKLKINDTVNAQKKGVYGIYFENLNSGAWLGVNERGQFIPASLLKTPVAAGIFRKIEDHELSLDTEVVINPRDINTMYGAMGMLKAGERVTVRDLINYTFYYSDNTAANALFNLLSRDEFIDATVGLGVPAASLKNVSEEGDLKISPKDYSHILLSLYHSSYLRRTHSNLILSYMSQTKFSQGLPAGVPSDIPVAHKVGYRPDPTYGEQHHDCGVIYYPPSPYILCIMTKGLSQKESDRFANGISKMIYDYVAAETQD